MRRIFFPTGTQTVLSLVISLLILALTFHNALISLISGASGITAGQFAASYRHALSVINDVGFVPKLTIGIFWAGVGMVGYFLVLTLSNFAIALRNEVVVDTTFTNLGGIGQRFRLPLVRLILTIAFGGFVLLSLHELLPLWIGLAGHLLLGGFSATSVAQLVVAVLGLALNVYAVWMLALAVKDLDSLL